MTTLEADYDRICPGRIRWVLSRVDVHDATKEITDQAAALLRTHRLLGHQIDERCDFVSDWTLPVILQFSLALSRS